MWARIPCSLQLMMCPLRVCILRIPTLFSAPYRDLPGGCSAADAQPHGDARPNTVAILLRRLPPGISERPVNSSNGFFWHPCLEQLWRLLLLCTLLASFCVYISDSQLHMNALTFCRLMGVEGENTCCCTLMHEETAWLSMFPVPVVWQRDLDNLVF